MSLAIAPEQVSEEAARLRIDEIAGFLQEHLGQRMTAYLGGVSDPKMVSRWISRQNAPREEGKMRLREGYQAARLLISAYGDEAAKAWLFGTNARLDDQAPAFVIRHAMAWEDLRFVVPAARAFAGAAN
jgi:hypothetical protein